MFSTCLTPAEIKSLYRNLALENHPDLGGSTRAMQDINAAYLTALKSLDGYKAPENDKGYAWTYRYNEGIEKSVMDKVRDLIALKLPSNVEVWIVGVWVYVKGITFDDTDSRTKVKDLNLKWHGTHKSWYWKPYKGRTHYSGSSFRTIAAVYGAKKVVEDDTKKSKALAIPA